MSTLNMVWFPQIFFELLAIYKKWDKFSGQKSWKTMKDLANFHETSWTVRSSWENKSCRKLGHQGQRSRSQTDLKVNFDLKIWLCIFQWIANTETTYLHYMVSLRWPYNIFSTEFEISIFFDIMANLPDFWNLWLRFFLGALAGCWKKPLLMLNTWE